MSDKECGYCGNSIDHSSPDHAHVSLVCSECDRYFHLDCLSGEQPPALIGDQLFQYSCSNCSLTGRDEWVRPHLNWVHVIHLALYNLMMTQDGRQGFFRWNSEICRFIEANWLCLMPRKAKTSSWKCTVAGILSVNCPAIFKSGTQDLGETGWWSLQNMTPPAWKDVATALANDRKKQLKKSLMEDSSGQSLVSVTVQELSRKRTLAETHLSDDKADSSIIQSKDSSSASNVVAQEMTDSKKRKMVRLTVSQEASVVKHIDKHSHYYRVDSCPTIARLYRKLKLRQRQRALGLKVFDIDEYIKEPVECYTTYSGSDDPVPVMKELSTPEPAPTVDYHTNDDVTLKKVAADIVSRLSLPLMPVLLAKGMYCRHKTLTTVTTFTSPYTSRVLKPIIFKSYEFVPVKVKLLTEIITKRHSSLSDDTISSYSPHPITFCYFREHHLSSVNTFVSYFFWPVNLKEYLQYPDFTVIIQYGKLVIGCGFMTPDVKVSEAYIPFLLVHPDFRGCGLGKIMLYHLIQSCQGKDVTLHVSIDNPAMLLYQQFGFKAEEFCINFYDKYYPPAYPLSKNAFLMRLRK